MVNCEYTCQDCEYCKSGYRFVREPVIREADMRIVISTTNREAYTHYCVKDVECVREVQPYQTVCEEHGELFIEED